MEICFCRSRERGEGYFDRFDFSEPYICIGGGSGAARDQQGSVASYERLVNALKKKEHPIYLVPASPGDSFLNEVADLTGAPVLPVEMAVLAGAAVLANATLFVSGRYHPSIMASLGGTPCIFLGSNSHKTESLQEIMEYETPQEFGAQPTDREVKRIVALADEYLSEGAAMRSKIHSTAARRGTEAAKILDVLAK